MNEKNKALGVKIFKAVKKSLSDARKTNKEKNLTGWNRHRQQVDIEVWDHNIWNNNGTRVVKSYIIKVNDKDMAEVRTHYDAAEIFSELRNQLNAQKKVKGWAGLSFDNERIYLGSGTWSDYEISGIRKVCLAVAPCNEYKSLMNFLNKYGNARLGNYELFSAAMGGKRGRLWDEYGERCFLDNKPNKCTRLLDEMRKARGTKDTITCKRGEENYIDEIDRKYSEYHEVECEGEKRKYIIVTIKTPTGKVKYESKIY